MSLSHSVYLALPVPLQNFALDMKGAMEKRTRFLGQYERQRRAAANFRSHDRRSVEEHALWRVNETLELAARGTIFYPRHWGAKIPPRLESLAQIQELPLVRKEQLRAQNELFRCSLVQTPITLQTTGTTGTPIQIFCNPSARQQNYAFFDDFLHSRGIEPRSRRAVFGGRVLLGTGQSAPYWRHSRSLNTYFFSSYHISPRTLPDYLSGLQLAEPDYLEAYPSVIGFLSRLINEGGARLGRSIPVVTSSETLDSEQRMEISQAFGCPVYDQYGAAEMCVFAEMCNFGRYHVRQDYSYVEVLKDDGSIAEAGDVGEVVCTGFLNPGMPLIRYAIGDAVEVAPDTPCACGWDTPTWSSILGRKDDVVWTRSGRAIGRLSPVLKGFPILKARYVQDHIDILRVLVVPGRQFAPRTIEAIRHAVELRVGSELKVVIEPVDELPDCPGGKHRSVVVSVARPRTDDSSGVR